MIKKMYKYHNEWLKIAYSILNNKQDAEDIVQDVYIKVYDKITKGQINPDNIMYNDDINKYYINRVITTTCLDFLRKKKKCVNIEWLNIKIHDELTEKENTFNLIYKNILKEIKKWNKTDSEIFNLYMTGLSMQKLSNIIGISKSSVFNSIKKSKNRLRYLFSEDVEDYFNSDYELIK